MDEGLLFILLITMNDGDASDDDILRLEDLVNEA